MCLSLQCWHCWHCENPWTMNQNHQLKMLMLSIVTWFPTDTLLVMAGVLLIVVAIRMIGWVGDMDGKGTAVATGAAAVGWSAFETGGVPSLS